MKSYFSKPKKIELGENVNIGANAEFHSEGGIIIGDGVIFAPDCILYTRTHNFNSIDLAALPYDNRIIVAPIEIKKYVWIGRRVVILPGVTINEGSIIGAGAIVAKDVPPFAIVVGNPAKIVGYRDKQKYLELLNEPKIFVYNKFGRKKVIVEKNKISNEKK